MGQMLQFRGVWRTYQARVLKNADKYLSDGKIHIVAAPGSGKTTLGIELIARMGKPALILAPSITIREQWEARIAEAFLAEGLNIKDYCSQDLKNPALITIATYQALHSAMTRYAGTIEEDTDDTDEEPCDEQRAEQVDFAGIDLVSVMKAYGIEVLCLDECHHLRSEWWKALEDFKTQMGGLKIIALTATPPYDSTPAMWKRYMDMCGEIDEEITIPELVKEGSLCPHQDYVYFNYPTAEEMKSIEDFQEKSRLLMEELLQDTQFAAAVSGHTFIQGRETDDTVLENPSYLASLLIYLNQRQLHYPKRFLQLLGVKKLPEMEPKWMEILLQKLLYDDVEAFPCNKTYRELLLERMKRDGFIERRKVFLTDSAGLEKLLLNSKGKINSIVKIAESEYDAMGKELRMLVLTDFIRKAYEKKLGADLDSDTPILGVLPFFEVLRKQFANTANPPRLGVLCGTIVIIPAEAKDALLQIVGDEKKVSFDAVGQLREQDYVQLHVRGDSHMLTSAVTEVFRQGYIQIMIGTKSLLGEGWDSPCINSLILASFVGSFMLSNQMRGRAIRVMKDKPDKTSNIWHLVCLKPAKIKKMEEAEGKNPDELSEDFRLLERKMEHFLGLHYTENTIESGIERLSIIRPPYRKSNIERMNKEMLAESGKRSQLKERWNNALMVYDKPEIVNESEVPDTRATVAVLYDALQNLLISTAFFAASFLVRICGNTNQTAEFVILLAIFGMTGLIAAFPKLFMLFSPYRRLKSIGNGILKALKEQRLLDEDTCKVVVENVTPAVHGVYLRGGSNRDKDLFAQCVVEFFGLIDNQRYLLVRKFLQNGKNAYYAVPEVFGRNKELAENFAKCMKRYIGKYVLIYTRSEQGRRLLQKGRVHAFANRNDRLINRKKVKGALE